MTGAGSGRPQQDETLDAVPTASAAAARTTKMMIQFDLVMNLIDLNSL